MVTIAVHTSKKYNILIGDGSFPGFGKEIASLFSGRRAVVISDDHVADLYGNILLDVLNKEGISSSLFVIEHGENNKNLSTVENILDYLVLHQLARSDFLIALGGGIVGDITGFAASIYLRGIPFIQIPTTLLAAVDSSVGGKTGVNLGGFKNQVGAFWQPSLVLCDPLLFSTLPEEEYSGGMAEVIKYATVFDRRMFHALADEIEIVKMIESCVRLKARVVETDERDRGERQLLNFGHTVGHAIEKVSLGTIHHGQAVAMGMVVATRSAEAAGICMEPFSSELVSLLRQYKLPVDISFPKESILSSIIGDKKRNGEIIQLILPESCGHCVIHPIEMKELASFLKM